MDFASETQHQFRFTGEDLGKLKSVVKRRASRSFGAVDLDDITGEILLSACVTAAKADATAPVAALAFRYAAMPSYYTAARKAAAAVAAEDPDWGSIPDASRSAQAVEIRDALRVLGPVSGQMIWRCDVEGMTLAETATTLGVSTATSHRRLKQAHDEFRAAWAA